MAPKVEQAEIERSRRKPTGNLDAYDWYLRGVASFHKWNRKGIIEALEFFRQAIALDGEFAAAYGMAAWCIVTRRFHNWMDDRTAETTEARYLARQAAKLGKDDAVALHTGGVALATIGEVDIGATLIDRALALNPNLASAWHNSGWVRVQLGEHETAIEHIKHAMRLIPSILCSSACTEPLVSAITSPAVMRKHRFGQTRRCGNSPIGSLAWA